MFRSRFYQHFINRGSHTGLRSVLVWLIHLGDKRIWAASFNFLSFQKHSLFIILNSFDWGEVVGVGIKVSLSVCWFFIDSWGESSSCPCDHNILECERFVAFLFHHELYRWSDGVHVMEEDNDVTLVQPKIEWVIHIPRGERRFCRLGFEVNYYMEERDDSSSSIL